MAFILIAGEYEVNVEVFATKEEAEHDAMVRDAEAKAWDAGIPEDEFNEFIEILEIPGLFIPESDTRLVKSLLRSFGVGQTNFEASETALDVCNILKKYV